LRAALGVHEGKRRLLFLAEGARWIREWFEGLAVKDKAMLLCWYHLVKHTEQLLSLACRGRQHRRAVQEPALRHLWHGRVPEALELLRQAREQMKKPEALDELVGPASVTQPWRRSSDEEARGAGRAGRVPGGAPAVPGRLRGAAPGGAVDRQQPGGEVPRPGHLGAVQAPGHGLDGRRGRGAGTAASGPAQRGAGPLPQARGTARLA